jgi:hypothetical protein
MKINGRELRFMAEMVADNYQILANSHSIF